MLINPYVHSHMYQQDSFFDLSAWGQLGLIAISTALFAAALLIAWRTLYARGPVLRIAGGFALLWLFVWLSPQVYYMYYYMIFPDLPLQWVIWPPPGPEKPMQMLFFQFRPNLSAHSQGLLGWSLIVTPFLRDWWHRRTLR